MMHSDYLKTITAVLCLTLNACATVGSADRPQNYYRDNPAENTSSLIGAATAGENEKRINELLLHQVKLPKENRIAIIKLSTDSYWRFYSNDFTELNDSLVRELILQLRASDRVYDASFLPAMLVPEKRTVPVLREAAARFQADLLLIYRSACNSYQKFRLMSADKTKSYCSVEAVLLDIRSGIITKSVVSTENFSATQQAGDTNFAETVKKAQLMAIAKALGKVASELVVHLEKVPVL